MRIAAIDLGSNSFHLLIVETHGTASFETVLQEKLMIQLGKTALVSGRLDPETMERGLRCLEEFRRMAMARRVERTLAVATSAIREAENGEEFLHRARTESGIPIRVISGREEARLIHLAVSRYVDLGSRKALLVDVGGGSVELTVGDSGRIYYATSQKLGFLRLHGRFVTSDPIKKRDERLLTAYLKDALAVPMANIRRQEPELVIATSGSAIATLQLAQQRRGERAADRPPSAPVSRNEIRAILSEALRFNLVERARKLDLDPLRSEYLPTALFCLDAILQEAGAKEMTVCPVALREGVILDFLLRRKPQAVIPDAAGDPRRQAIMDLAVRCDYAAEHSHKVAQLACQIFQQTTHLHGLGEGEARLLDYAAILHDLGYHIGYSKHHKHGYYLVMNCDLRGFSPEERAILAQLVRYHRRAAPKKSHAAFEALPARTKKIVKYLSSILRIADGLDRSHFSYVDEVRCRSSRKNVQFLLATGARHSDIDMDLYTAKRHARCFERLFGVETSFAAARGSARGAQLEVPAPPAGPQKGKKIGM